MTISKAISQKLKTLSSRPGVYLFRDRLGKVIYVGKAKSLNKRVRSYFQQGRYSQMEPKTKALVDMAHDLEIHEVRNETEAILLEGKLIKQYKPKYNIAFRDDKHFLLVKLTQDPFPRLVLTRLQKPDGCRYFGPFIHSVALRNTLEYIRKNFHIRSCSPPQPGEKDYKHCINDIIKHCSAPCIHRVSQEEYQRWIQRACALLEGKDEDALKDLETEMIKAAARKDFEKAAQLRDALYDLRITVKQSARKFARDLPRSFRAKEELASLAHELSLPHPPRIIEGFDISHIHGRHTVGSMVQFLDGRPQKAQYRHFTVRGKGAPEASPQSHPPPASPESLQNDDCASIREIEGRRYRRLHSEGKTLPDLILIDGGRGQLNAARAALEEIPLNTTVIGLAKQEEEIYIPENPTPLRLDRVSPALHLLQRIRDESHRFANTLHEGWRRKQIRESMLDEIPGIGSIRKRELLKTFRSIERLKNATLEEIQRVPGFGGKNGQDLWQQLHPT